MDAQPAAKQTAAARPFFETGALPSGWRERAESFADDERPFKLNLGPGILTLDDGTVPVLSSVVEASSQVRGDPRRAYLPTEGLPQFRKSMHRALLGAQLSECVDRSFSVQALGGTHALRLGAEVLARTGIASQVLLSAESWATHRYIFEYAGLRVGSYPYLSPSGRGIDIDRLVGALEHAPEGAVVLLQACCHNPTGYDLSPEGWARIFEVLAARRLLPFFDVAYAGLDRGFEADMAPVRDCVARGIDLFAATSCRKMFSMYDSPIGALTVVTSSADAAPALRAQIKGEIRASVTGAPYFGAAVITQILGDTALRDRWSNDLAEVRNMLQGRRQLLNDQLELQRAPRELLDIGDQHGLFAWTGFSREQSARLAADFAIYAPSNGRLSLGTLSTRDIPNVAFALAKVAKGR